MSRTRRSIVCPRDPIGLSIEEAAAYLSVSPDLFQRAVDDGSMPAPRKMFGRLIWDADEVAAAFRRLPKKGDEGDNWWERVKA